MASTSDKFNFFIDRGGTFTDIVAQIPQQSQPIVRKLLSVDPENYSDAPTEGIRRILNEFKKREEPLISREDKVPSRRINEIRMGTTVATNGLLERAGPDVCLAVTQGFENLLAIGNQSRPRLFDLRINKPSLLYSKVIEVDERVVLPSSINASGRQTSNETVEVEKVLDIDKVRNQLKEVYSNGIRNLAVVLMHSALFPEHELQVGKIAKEVGFSQVSLSHQVNQMVKIVPRGLTATADAYLSPFIKEYLDRFTSGFDSDFHKVKLSFMQSDGGLTDARSFSGHKAVLSGPAGGVVGLAHTAYFEQKKFNKNDHIFPVIGFDMGGTSTDVTRFDGEFEHVFDSEIAGVIIQSPQLQILTVAAGGYLAVTDANLCLGRIVPELFPKIFGPNENEPLDLDGTKKAFEGLTQEVNKLTTSKKSAEEIALGFLNVANESMCRPIREMTSMKGYDVKNHILSCFGGAAGQHGCAIAKKLGLKKVFVHRASGVLSAFGMGLADIVQEDREPCSFVFWDGKEEAQIKKSEVLLVDQLKDLKKKVVSQLSSKQGKSVDEVNVLYYLNLRYEKTETGIMTQVDLDNLHEGAEAFFCEYERQFGFVLTGRDVLVDDIRVRCSISSKNQSKSLSSAFNNQNTFLKDGIEEIMSSKVYFANGWLLTKIYSMDTILKTLKRKVRGSEDLKAKIIGPAIIAEANSTILIEPYCEAQVTLDGDVLIEIKSYQQAPGAIEEKVYRDPVELAIFANRFMSIAEQMGRTLQRTSVSVNIKERLDFSCALFGPKGDLVANAPHIPVHLGAMQEAVRSQISFWAADDVTPMIKDIQEKYCFSEGVNEGDVFVSNHPQLAGGSHLPDITVMTPVFEKGNIVFWVASRGHHADVGGITPGTVGLAIVTFKLVEQFVFQEKKLRKLLEEYSVRQIEDNVSDLKAQVAANNQGIVLVKELIEQEGLDKVHAYMDFIMDNAEEAVKAMLKKLRNVGSSVFFFLYLAGTQGFSAEDYMDDGTKIKLEVSIEGSGEAVFDFTGTGPQVNGNTNAPPAVTYSAIIYALRCMLGFYDEASGCLRPVKVVIPERSILNPGPEAAVVGGNVLTSQRLVDVIFKAFETVAASQGCTNNLTFGDDSFGYYETIAGGSGAGPGFNGTDGVHTHITNTRITDPEILERRYPVILRRFTFRKGSGGDGEFKGGEGVIRDIEVLRPLKISLLTERRKFHPYGLNGGGSGKVGINEFKSKATDTWERLPGKTTISAEPGDRLALHTPGAGGYGRAK
eukprot:augustus_masked-scaffold_3-processed-gene-3.72-mRNA-1 protein AED:0.12 eAED:0.12 QI:0/0/0/1/1/1/4/0/1258